MKKLNRITPLSKTAMAIWWTCRALLLIWGIVNLFYGYTSQFVQAVFAIIFTHLWDMFQLFGGKSFITLVPAYLQTELNIFICFGCVVGSTINEHTNFTGIDIPEHIFAGFLACSFGFVLSDIMQGDRKKIKPAVQALFGFAFGVALMVGWEFYEFTMDRLYGFDMQHGLPYAQDGLVDTMVDLILGAGGALAAMFIEAFRRTGIIGTGRKEKREAYLKERAKDKEDKKKRIEAAEAAEKAEM